MTKEFRTQASIDAEHTRNRVRSGEAGRDLSAAREKEEGLISRLESAVKDVRAGGDVTEDLSQILADIRSARIARRHLEEIIKKVDLEDIEFRLRGSIDSFVNDIVKLYTDGELRSEIGFEEIREVVSRRLPLVYMPAKDMGDKNIGRDLLSVYFEHSVDPKYRGPHLKPSDGTLSGPGSEDGKKEAFEKLVNKVAASVKKKVDSERARRE